MSSRNTLEVIRRKASQGKHAEAASECLALLKQQPRNIEANLEYGHLAIALRRPDDAIIIFRKLLALVPDHIVAHDRLAHLYRQSGDYSSAEKHAHFALQRDARLVNSRLALAAIAIARDDIDQALAIFEALRRELPDDLHIGITHADALIRIGKFETARLLIRQLLESHPDGALLYLLLSRTGKLREDSPDTALIRALGNGRGKLVHDFSNAEDQVHAYMALFKAESDCGHPAVAFNYLRQAKLLRKRQFPQQPEQVSRLYEEIRQTFSCNLVHAADGHGAASDAPIFIVGMPRSGTTLLERVVCSHPDVVPGGELQAVNQVVQELCAHYGDNQNDIGSVPRIPPDMWKQAGEEYLRRARRLVGDAPHFTDKMPENYMWLGAIRAMLPNARIIHLSRHPIDTCLSIYEQDFATARPWANDLKSLGAHYHAYRNLLQHWRTLFGEHLIELEYEALVTDTENICARLGRQLGLQLPLDRLTSTQGQGEMLTASMWQARQPIHSESISRWRPLRAELQPLLDVLAPGS
ncbi:tetratricopeptide repeat-containing sulfotransferase family protein [Haliea sp. E17]|uniref:tetratricopeptide repeat-containing sulfotransferase family protein n=1 Tax=Haliea sp. E17 TaxID=3401576 RepID=UPI003AAC014C